LAESERQSDTRPVSRDIARALSRSLHRLSHKLRHLASPWRRRNLSTMKRSIIGTISLVGSEIVRSGRSCKHFGIGEEIVIRGCRQFEHSFDVVSICESSCPPTHREALARPVLVSACMLPAIVAREKSTHTGSIGDVVAAVPTFRVRYKRALSRLLDRDALVSSQDPAAPFATQALASVLHAVGPIQRTVGWIFESGQPKVVNCR
jgi:hypothetical protein